MKCEEPGCVNGWVLLDGRPFWLYYRQDRVPCPSCNGTGQQSPEAEMRWDQHKDRDDDR